MTEEEWLTATDPAAVLEVLRGKTSDRKLRLFACAIARSSSIYSEIEWWVRIAERFADGLVEQDELAGARQRRARPFSPLIFASWVLSSDLVTQTAEVLKVGKWDQAGIVRDVFGNPFRPAPFSPDWRTTTAVALAAQMYESRDFSALPILADALQDAGCDRADVLNHCRAEGPHVRGCWVIPGAVVGRGAVPAADDGAQVRGEHARVPSGGAVWVLRGVGVGERVRRGERSVAGGPRGDDGARGLGLSPGVGGAGGHARGCGSPFRSKPGRVWERGRSGRWPSGGRDRPGCEPGAISEGHPWAEEIEATPHPIP